MLISLLVGLVVAEPMIERGIVYANPTGETLRLDVFRPAETPKAPIPGVIVIHGGAWMSGRREDMDAFAMMIAREGMVAATVTYRLAPKHRWPTMLDDVQTAVRFLRAESKRFGVDPTRVGAAGASAGGHLALLLGYRDTRDRRPAEHANQSSRVQAVLNVFGPTDMSRDFGPMFEPMYHVLLGKSRSEAAAEIRDASPVTHIDAKSAPTFTFHGTRDTLVPVAQARWLTEKLAAAKVPHQTVIVDGVGHEVPMENRTVAQAVRDGLAFLRKHLGLPR